MGVCWIAWYEQISVIKLADWRTLRSNDRVEKCNVLMSNVKNITKNEQYEEWSDKTRSEEIVINWGENVKLKYEHGSMLWLVELLERFSEWKEDTEGI